MKAKKIICTVLAAIFLIQILSTCIFAADSEKSSDAKNAVYTMWGNNILMSNIAENGLKTNPDGSLVYEYMPGARYKKLYSALSHYSPDVVAFQECDIGWHNIIDDHGGYATANGYKPLSTLGYANVLDSAKYRIEGVRNPIYYKTDRFLLVESGIVSYGDPTNNYYEDPWVFCWAILEDKTNQNRFITASTHIISSPKGDTQQKADQIGELVRYVKNLETKNKIPFIMMGDYNCDPSYAKAYTQFKVGEKTLSARDVANTVTGKNYMTHNNMGQPPAQTGASGGGVIDHAIISTVGIAPEKYEIMVETFDKVNNISTYSYSDHVPQRLTFRIVGSDHIHAKGETVAVDENRHFTKCPECYLGEYSSHDNYGGCDPNVDDSQNLVTCASCGTKVKNHDYKYTSNGDKENSTHSAKCQKCGKETSALAHEWIEQHVKPTYKSDGYTLYVCTQCSQTRKVTHVNTKLSVPKSPFELGECGQQTFYAGETDLSAPKSDGKIGRYEYVFRLFDLKPENDEQDDRFFFKLANGKKNDIENVNLYISYDNDTLYFGAEVTDNELCSNQYADSICIYIGTENDTEKLDMFYLPRYEKGTTEAWPHDKELPTPQDAEKESAIYVRSQAIKLSGNKITYELALKRSALCDTPFDELFLSFIIRSGVGSPNQDALMFVGVNAKDLGLDEVYAPHETGLGDIYPHVLKLSEMPEQTTDTLPQTEASQTQGAETPTSSSSEQNTSEKGCRATHAIPTAMISAAAVCAFFTLNKRRAKKL